MPFFWLSGVREFALTILGGTTDGTGSSKAPARSVADEIEAAGGEAIANFDDVSEADGANNPIRQTLDRYGTIDILICNAGILRDKTFFEDACRRLWARAVHSSHGKRLCH